MARGRRLPELLGQPLGNVAPHRQSDAVAMDLRAGDQQGHRRGSADQRRPYRSVPLLATLGIVSLFLFAGLEVDFEDLRRGIAVTSGHLGLQLVLLAGGTLLLGWLFDLSWRPSLAILTPSTGFILDSLPAFGLTPHQQFSLPGLPLRLAPPDFAAPEVSRTSQFSPADAVTVVEGPRGVDADVRHAR